MAFVVSHWERRDVADREALGSAALGWCHAAEERKGVIRARFYWAGTEQIVTITEVESFDALDADGAADPVFVAAELRLGDLARPGVTERWTEPRDGQSHYRAALTLREALDMP